VRAVSALAHREQSESCNDFGSQGSGGEGAE